MVWKMNGYLELDQERFSEDRGLLEKIASIEDSPSYTRQAANLILAMASQGAATVIDEEVRRRRTDETRRARRDELIDLVGEYNQHGLLALFKPGPARGGDFLINQARGEWAEDSFKLGLEETGAFRAMKFGPSTAPMPGEEDYILRVANLQLIGLLEGKRPDLLVIESEAWDRLSQSQKELAQTKDLSVMLVMNDLEELVKSSTGAVEVKSSQWLALERRPDSPLSVTLKDEEIEVFETWIDKYRIPVAIAQVFFDSVYMRSFTDLLTAIGKGESGGFPVIEEKDRKTGKPTYRIPLTEEHQCGTISLPTESRVEFLHKANAELIPYIRFSGPPMSDVDVSKIRRALRRR